MNIENTEQLIDLIEDKAYPPLSKSTIDGLKTGDASTYGSLAFLEHAEALVRQHSDNPVIQQFVKENSDAINANAAEYAKYAPLRSYQPLNPETQFANSVARALTEHMEATRGVDVERIQCGDPTPKTNEVFNKIVDTAYETVPKTEEVTKAEVGEWFSDHIKAVATDALESLSNSEKIAIVKEDHVDVTPLVDNQEKLHQAVSQIIEHRAEYEAHAKLNTTRLGFELSDGYDFAFENRDDAEKYLSELEETFASISDEAEDLEDHGYAEEAEIEYSKANAINDEIEALEGFIEEQFSHDVSRPPSI